MVISNPQLEFVVARSRYREAYLHVCFKAMSKFKLFPSSETTNDEGRIKLLLERFKTATLIVDRRDAMDNLRVLASANQKLVANLTFSDLMSTLKVERDEDLIQLTVETLVELVTIQEDNGNLIEKGGESVPLDSKEASNQNAELLLKDHNNMEALLELLSHEGLWIRYYTIDLLRILLSLKKKLFEETIKKCTMGISKMVDLLKDNREEIRMLSLPLLEKLTEVQEVQTLCAFNEGFEHLFKIMFQEDVYEATKLDCLKIVSNMLIDNDISSKMFMQSRAPVFLVKILKSPITDVELYVVCFRIISSLIQMDKSPLSDAPLEANRLKQLKTLKTNLTNKTSGFVEIFVKLSFELKMEKFDNSYAIEVLSEFVSDNGPGSLVVSNTKINSALHSEISVLSYCVEVLFYSEDVKLRDSVENLLNKMLLNNESMQISIIGHVVTPPPIFDESDKPETPVGRIIINEFVNMCDGVLSSSSNNEDIFVIKMWRSGLLLASILAQSSAAKELAMKCQTSTETTMGNTSNTFFIQYCISSLEAAFKSDVPLRTKVILCRLLCEWFSGCPTAIYELLSSPARVVNFIDFVSGGDSSPTKSKSPFHTPVKHPSSESVDAIQIQSLAAMILATCVDSIPISNKSSGGDGKMDRSALINMISNRIGLDVFTAKLDKLEKTNPFIKASRRLGNKINSSKSKKLDASDSEDNLPLYDYSFISTFKSIQREFKNRITEFYTASDSSKGDINAEGGFNATSGEALKSLVRSQDSEIKELHAKLKVFELSSKSESWLNERSDLESKVLEANENVSKMGIEINKISAAKKECENTALKKIEELESLRKIFNELEIKFEKSEQELNQTKREKNIMEADLEALSLYGSDTSAKEKMILEAENRANLAEKTALQLKIKNDENIKEIEKIKVALEEAKITNLELLNSIEIMKKLKSSEESYTSTNENLALAKEMETLKEEHEDLLVCLAGMDFQKRYLASTLKAYKGDVAVEHALNEAAEALEQYVREE